MKHPYAVPTRLVPDLARVQAYWRGLLRGAASMPFWDDVRLQDLPGLEARLLLVDVFDRPERFRFASVGQEIGGREFEGRFLDDLRLGRPFEFLLSQASATVEAAQPTHYRFDPGRGKGGKPPYARLLLPLWGEGRISMMLGAVAFDAG